MESPALPAVAALSDIQHNLHGACLADAASVRSGWVSNHTSYPHIFKCFGIQLVFLRYI
jgi:hypothetical protein